MGEQATASPDFKALLLADLEHFGESLWRNEEMGEKRLNFFLTLVTAVTAGLVALATAQKPPAPAQFERIAALSLGALLLVGMLTYLRMLQRNAVTDEFKATLRAIRDRYVAQAGGSGGSDYGVPVQRRKPAKWLRGGYAETVGTANGVLLLALLVLRGAHPLLALLLGAALAADLWRLAVLRRT